MKTVISCCVLAMAITSFGNAQEMLRPLVAREFGKPITIKAEFVAKSKDYRSQNIVREPYTLKVSVVDGKTLKDPVLIEYRLVTKETKPDKMERPGVVAVFEAYESLYQPAMATPWLGDFEQGTGFALIHVLYIRPPARKG